MECGDACAYVAVDAGATNAGHRYPYKHRTFQCAASWARLLAQCPAADWPPPTDIPSDLLDAYTMGGLITVDRAYYKQRYSGASALANNWDALNLDARAAAASVADAVGGIGTYDIGSALYVDAIIVQHLDAVAGRSGVVWGSEKPWLEVLLARRGAAMTLTAEYGGIKSSHPSIKTATPQAFASFMLQDDVKFDFAFTYSSLEHSGLGRYGDALNPYGDLEAVAQTWCALKPGGYFFLGVPSLDKDASKDMLVFNAHRLYGPHRLAQMFAGYQHVKTYADNSSPGVSIVHVLRKPLLV